MVWWDRNEEDSPGPLGTAGEAKSDIKNKGGVGGKTEGVRGEVKT